MSYLQRLIANDSEKQTTKVQPKLQKAPLGSKDSSQRVHFSENDDQKPGMVVAMVPSLSKFNRQKLLDYLAAIGETNQEMIDELLTECQHNPDILAWALQWADNILSLQQKPKPVTFDDRRHCANCKNLTESRRCLAQVNKYFPNDDLPRRCCSFLPKPDEGDQRTGIERWPNLKF